ncbi:MAG: adenylate/guanylate cyclase domain-containing protein [Magnetococcales bacterium]|nr:adenylate/guanylate cyclase domain-containing protein [Magnetococcales bacterium]
MKGLHKRYDIWLTILLFLLVIPLERFEAFSLIEDQTLSVRHILRMSYADPEKTEFPDEIVLVNTDEAFFQEYKSFPLRRTDIGKMVDVLHALGAKVIALDVLMDFPSSYNEDPETAASLKRAGNTLLVSQAAIVNGKFDKINYPTQTLKEVSRSGYTNISSSSTLITILSRLKVHAEITKQPDGWPFAVQALAMFWDVEPKLEGHTLKLGDRRSIQLDEFNTFYIDFPALQHGSQFLSQTKGFSAMDILELDEDEFEDMRGLFEGKIVIVGDTSEVSHDWFDTPVGMVYGVEIIADTIATLMKGATLQPASQPVEIAISMIFMILLLATAFIHSPSKRVFLSFFFVLLFLSVALYAYIHQDLIISMSYTMIAGFMGFILINLRFYIQERGQKKMIKGAFGQYLSPKVVDILVKDPSKLSLGGEQREMTAFFSDVAGFSSISEKLTPAELVALLNDYLTAMCDIISRYDGTVDKFEGDAIIAFWNAPIDQPDHAKLSCYNSIDMQKYMVGLRERLAKENGPHMTIRIGMNSGPMVVGNMGSAQRMDYTIMGDAVNLAARLEGANKFYTSGTMISEYTYEPAKDFIDARQLDTVLVIGKKEPVTIYQLLDRKDQTAGKLAEVVDLFHKGREKYLTMDFKGAKDIFEKALAIMPDDGPSLTYQARCTEYMESPPPEDWGGVFQFTSKG